MTQAFENADETHRIEGTDDLLMSVIVDQAADLEHGWREAIQNGIDSPGSERVELTFDYDSTVVQDDGEGVDLTAERGINLLTNLGESSKSDDEDTIGEFGIGKGQIVAKGVTTMMSDDQALIFDVKNHGLKVAQRTLDEPVDGFRVEVEHYTDEVPSSTSYRWGRYEERIKERFQYVTEATGVEVVVNDDIVSRERPEDVVEGRRHAVSETLTVEDLGDVHIAVEHSASEDLTVYSRGVKVKDVESRGLGGVVVSEPNFELNFARNDIKSGCPLWRAVSERLDDIREELFLDVPDDRLTDDARRHIADRMLALAESGDIDALDKFAEKRVFKTAVGDHVSINQVAEKGKVGLAPAGDPAAEKLNSAYGMMVLSEDDEATSRIQDIIEEAQEHIPEPEEFDAREKAEELGMFDERTHIPNEELSPNRQKRLKVARYIADRMGINRTVYYGESDLYDAWTDGHSEIVITDDCMPSSNRLAWMPELFETLVHQYSHSGSTMNGCGDHSISFNKNYRRNMDEMWPEFSQFMADASRTSVKQMVEDVEL